MQKISGGGGGGSATNRHKSFRRQGFARTRLYSQFGGIGTVSLSTSWFRRTERSIWMYTVSNWTNWTQPSTRNVQNRWVARASSSIITTPGRTHYCKPEKNFWSWTGMSYHILRIHQTLPLQITTISLSTEFLEWWETWFLRKALNTSWNGCLSRQINFFERGIMKLLERWQKIIDQSSQYIVE